MIDYFHNNILKQNAFPPLCIKCNVWFLSAKFLLLALPVIIPNLWMFIKKKDSWWQGYNLFDMHIFSAGCACVYECEVYIFMQQTLKGSLVLRGENKNVLHRHIIQTIILSCPMPAHTLSSYNEIKVITHKKFSLLLNLFSFIQGFTN